MKKDVIYIDVEDDITSIIEKLKGAKASIVALVPPRRLGVLQSVVNLKLLKRAADEAGKKAVLITSDKALISLTAGLNLPVARNLQSRPELIPAADADLDDNEVIEGEDLTAAPEKEPAPAAITPKAAPAPKPLTPRPGKKFKVPNFDAFRKKAAIAGLIIAVLIAGLVWAVAYAPKATITIQAKTEKIEGKMSVTFDSELPRTEAKAGMVKAEIHEDKRNLTQAFTATGTKEVGEKAKGTITIRNCDYPDGFTLQAGARFTSNSGKGFVSTQSVTVPKFTGSASSCSTSGGSAGKADVNVEAAAIGDEYNVSGQTYSLPGISGKVDAVGSAMTGGSKRQITVVTQDDVNKAKAQLQQQDQNAIKSALKDGFDDNMRALEDTFVAKEGTAAVQPGVDQEASQATLTVPMTYTMLGAKNDDISAVLSGYFEEKIDDKQKQGVFDNGYGRLEIKVGDKPSPQKALATLETDGHLGPNINTDELKKQLSGKRHGEIEGQVMRLPGIENVESKFSPFWVSKAPKAERITIKLEVANAQ